MNVTSRFFLIISFVLVAGGVTHAGGAVVEQERDLCPVCFDWLNDASTYRLPCRHGMCAACGYLLYIEHRAEPLCPLCRAVVPATSVVQLACVGGSTGRIVLTKLEQAARTFGGVAGRPFRFLDRFLPHGWVGLISVAGVAEYFWQDSLRHIGRIPTPLWCTYATFLLYYRCRAYGRSIVKILHRMTEWVESGQALENFDALASDDE